MFNLKTIKIMKNYSMSDLFKTANAIRAQRGYDVISQKEAIALAKEQLAGKVEKRGKYPRTDEWKSKHGEQMRAFWAQWRAKRMAA